ncbi:MULTISPECIES: hypothetical protein [Bacillus cereus group]|uniref:YokE-like PH domain-containing protein n=1 Tax=Bacillus cereus TaxID=1396 RepID=A0ABD4LF21_BACCE|nr:MULTISPECIES: hypothetical protein [Bacillus cereus group]MBK1608808.1 hypothetical protein [Bacillus cereus]MEC0073897.1 hypothetical protein [Bacillus anthracis]MEC0099026.1 hypothetical protein [Bacillus anthracis]BCC53561.1 hypothetical protein BCJMU07_2911 [Bacillus cereus]BCC77356.1 hypothetical protein BCJMU62_3047 [Bacillus cereus]
MNIDINRLTDICLEYQQSRFYVTRIPKDFLSIARKRFSIPTDDQIIAFLSCNLFGSGKYGVYFTSSGLYWKNWLLGKGNMQWDQLNEVRQIEIDKDGFLSFDVQKSFNINGSDYPPLLFKELLMALTNSFQNSKQNDIHPAIKINEIKSICSLFETHNELLEPDNGLFVETHISDKKLKEIEARFIIPIEEQIIAFLDTSVLGNIGKGSDGVLICQSGIYFRETFVHLYYPWHIFRNIPITLASDEFKIGKRNIFHLQHARMPSEEILLFIKNIKKYVNSLYEEHPELHI